MLKRIWKWMTEREPLVIWNTLAAAVYGFVQEAQGDLTGRDAWIALGWALLVAGSRYFVTPTARQGNTSVNVTMDGAIKDARELRETVAQLAEQMGLRKGDAL